METSIKTLDHDTHAIQLKIYVKSISFSQNNLFR